MAGNLLVLGRAADPPIRALRRVVGPGEWRWAYLGADFPRAVRVAQAVGTRAHRLDVGKELNRVAREAAHDLVETLALLRGEDDPLEWWTDSLSERSPYLCPLIRECALLRVAEKWLGGEGPILLFIEGEALRAVIARMALDRRWRVVDAAGWLGHARLALRRVLRRIGAPILFLVLGLLRFFQRRLSGRTLANGPSPNPPEILCFSFVGREALWQPPRATDPYWGPLIPWLHGRGHRIALVPVTVGRPLSPTRVTSLLDGRGVAVVTPEDYLRPRDYLWAAWRGVRAARRPLPAVNFGGINIRALCAEERARYGGSLRLPLTLLQYRLALRLARSLPALRACLYPFENQVWERALLLGLREARSDLAAIGFQHSTIAPLEMNYFPAKGDSRDLPLPDRVVCHGERFRDVLEAAGYPSSRLAVGSSLRYPHLLGASHTGGRRARARQSVLILLSIVLAEAAEVLWKAIRGLAGITGVRMVVRAHPFVPLREVLAALGEANLPPGMEEETGPIEESLEQTDCIVYRDTSAAFEAAAQGIPGVYVASEVTVDNDPLDLLGPIDGLKRIARSVTEIRAAVEELLTADPVARMGWVQTAEALRKRTLKPVDDAGLNAFLTGAGAETQVISASVGQGGER